MGAIRVLVVDDEETVVDVLRSLIGSDPALELVGTAHDADRAIDLAISEQPDVVLMDVRMPGGGGIRAVREITRRSPETKVVALSAHEDEDTRIRMIGAGARDYVPKSESADTILEAIRRSARPARRGARAGHRLRAADGRRSEQRARVERALRGGCITSTFQPIVDLETGAVVGVQARPRVALLPSRPYDAWTGEADAVGLLPRVESAALRSALAALPSMPADVFVEFEVSPVSARLARFQRAIPDRWASNVVLTVSVLAGPDLDLSAALEPLRARGVRVALSGVGTGMDGLEHLAGLWPEFVRLDPTLSEGVEHDETRHAIVAAVVGWSTMGGAAVVAEGVATHEQAEELGRLGVRLVQGDLVGTATHLGELVRHGSDHAGLRSGRPDTDGREA
jgi:DNA-binding NarL/FixJ family response regulator/EAL domain-containing protein (putative c-di-GMP-specific phosphodiesterase class I)